MQAHLSGPAACYSADNKRRNLHLIYAQNLTSTIREYDPRLPRFRIVSKRKRLVRLCRVRDGSAAVMYVPVRLRWMM
eukprot:4533070-Prymnesium_polylepis.1